jgi:hypothetical protein
MKGSVRRRLVGVLTNMVNVLLLLLLLLPG